MPTTDDTIDPAATAVAIERQMAVDTAALSLDLKIESYWRRLAVIASSTKLTHEEKMIEVSELNKKFGIA